MIAGMLSAGIDLRSAIRTKRLMVQTGLPEAMGSDNHLIRALEAIHRFKPDHLVIDAISACVRMGSGQAAFDYLMRLVSVVKERGITAILTNQTTGLTDGGEELSGIGFSSVVDAVIQLLSYCGFILPIEQPRNLGASRNTWDAHIGWSIDPRSARRARPARDVRAAARAGRSLRACARARCRAVVRRVVTDVATASGKRCCEHPDRDQHLYSFHRPTTSTHFGGSCSRPCATLLNARACVC
jgi:hypothetical protein